MLAQAKNDGVISSLLLLVADLIPFLAASPIPGQQGASRELVSYIISRRVKVSICRKHSLALTWHANDLLVAILLHVCTAAHSHDRPLQTAESHARLSTSIFEVNFRQYFTRSVFKA